jgi:hypothetical protein
VTDSLKNNSDSRASASDNAVSESSPRPRHSIKCPHCHKVIHLHRWLVPPDIRRGPKVKGMVGRDPKKAPLFYEALSLHSQGLSWAKIARKLDPDGFKKDPNRARERIRKGAHHYAHSTGWLLVPEPPGKN